MSVRKRLASIRHRMKKSGLAAYLVPGTDPHMSEYLPDRWKRREWISGFTGSAGEFVVTQKMAGLWTDGRYFVQAERELKDSGVTLFRQGEEGVPTIGEFLAKSLAKGKSVGCDPRLLSITRAEKLESQLAEVGAKLKCLEENLVDLGWDDQPGFPSEPLEILAKRYAGKSVADKLRAVRAEMRDRGANLHVLSTLDSIAWLFNIRGRDVEFNPVVIAYALISQKEAQLFVQPGKFPTQLRAKLGREVSVRPYDGFGAALRKRCNANQTVWLDGDSATRWILDRCKGARVLRETSPIVHMKARKNPVEIRGMRSCHERDGVAVVRFLHWLSGSVKAGDQTEMSAAAKLAEFRSEGQAFKGLSFRTISGYGANGAIVHYSVDESTDTKLLPKGIYLVDSGGQYLDGTTDITRTVLLGGRATKEQKQNFTRVLKGHIALARARFPEGVRGMRLDTLARMYLWEAGLDYNHGTGHGVGHYLNVHEGPQSISPGRCNGAALEAGNIQSNEPGYYKVGEYGIRIENLVLVEEDETISTKQAGYLRFETLTLCPIDQRLIEKKMLLAHELDWLNRYHARVYATLKGRLEKSDQVWLKSACAKL